MNREELWHSISNASSTNTVLAISCANSLNQTNRPTLLLPSLPDLPRTLRFVFSLSATGDQPRTSPRKKR